MTAKEIYLLRSQLPKGTMGRILEIVGDEEFRIRMVNPRRTIMGSCLFSSKPGKVPVITINLNLEPSVFIFVFLHEFAHYLVKKKHSMNLSPKINILGHGKIFISEYKALLKYFIDDEWIGTELRNKLVESFTDEEELPKDEIMYCRFFSELFYDDTWVELATLPNNTFFKLMCGKLYITQDSIYSNTIRCVYAPQGPPAWGWGVYLKRDTRVKPV